MEQNTSVGTIQVDPYQDQLWMKPVATIFYVLGLICCIFLGCVVWFERTKKFAPHRTLTQQMTSYSLILVKLFKKYFFREIKCPKHAIWKLQHFMIFDFLTKIP